MGGAGRGRSGEGDSEGGGWDANGGDEAWGGGMTTVDIRDPSPEPAHGPHGPGCEWDGQHSPKTR